MTPIHLLETSCAPLFTLLLLLIAHALAILNAAGLAGIVDWEKFAVKIISLSRPTAKI